MPPSDCSRGGYAGFDPTPIQPPCSASRGISRRANQTRSGSAGFRFARQSSTKICLLDTECSGGELVEVDRHRCRATLHPLGDQMD